MDKKAILDGLSNPRRECRGRTRWWWYGCAVEKEEIQRELDFIAEAGLGGVEPQILYPLDADDAEKGIKHEDYLSPGYMENIRFAAEEAQNGDSSLT